MAAVKKWGQVIEDHGYMTGECSHAYRSVMFEARAEFVEDLDEKRRALSLMIDHADPDPEPLKQKLVATADLKQVLVIRLVIDRMSGKHRQGAASHPRCFHHGNKVRSDVSSVLVTVQWNEQARDVNPIP